MQGHGGCGYVDHVEFSYKIKREDACNATHGSGMKQQDRNLKSGKKSLKRWQITNYGVLII
jgi:hypothetical protein